MNYEQQVRQQMERVAAQQCPVEGDINAAMDNTSNYPRSMGLRNFAKDSKRLKKLGGKFRPKAAQRKGI